MEKKSFWVARDKDGCLYLYQNKPERIESTNEFYDIEYDSRPKKLDRRIFPEVTWENSPVELKLCL